MTVPWRIVFFGTPEFARPTLSAIAGTDDTVVAVICQPDRPQGRGRKMSPPPIKVLAQDLNLPIWQPEKMRDPETMDRLKAYKPDLLVVVAFGQILPKAVLDMAPHGAINLHPSLLPAHRGPAPINWAILNGDDQTGVTTMLLDEGVDTGPILLSQGENIGPNETAGDLHDRLSIIGAELMLRTINGMKAGAIKPVPQDDSKASRGRLLTKQDGLVDWNRAAEELSRQVRGLDPWPGAYTSFNGKNLKLFGATVGTGRGKPGQVLAVQDGRLHIATGNGSLGLKELQLAGKKRQTATDFRHGQRLSQNDFFGS
jgi:methionyl-tRNA formyltransferase